MRAASAQVGGLILAPAAWTVNTQLGQILPYVDCAGGMMFTAGASFVAALLATVGTLVSYRACSAATSRRRMFAASLGLLTGASFAFAIFLQGAASLLLNPCER